ncbi:MULTISPECIES: hypothetical protein [unclassified Nonomuraea]
MTLNVNEQPNSTWLAAIDGKWDDLVEIMKQDDLEAMEVAGIHAC